MNIQTTQQRYRFTPVERTAALNIECREQSGVTVISPLDPVVIGASNAHDFEEIVVGCLAGHSPVVLDASMIEFFEEQGIDCLLSFDRRARELGVPFVLCALNDALEQVFRIYGLDCLFKVFPSVESGIRFLTRSAVWH